MNIIYYYTLFVFLGGENEKGESYKEIVKYENRKYGHITKIMFHFQKA